MSEARTPTTSGMTQRVIEQLAISPEDAQLLDEACRAFNVNPDPELQPRELASFRIGGDARSFDPRYVSIVTCGGLKLRYPVDADTERRLRYDVFRSWKKGGKYNDEITELPLPHVLHLPIHHRTGIPPVRMGG